MTSLFRNFLIGSAAIIGTIDLQTANVVGSVLLLLGTTLGIVGSYFMANRAATSAANLADAQAVAAMALETQREIARREELAAQTELIVHQITLAQLQQAAEVKSKLEETAAKLADTTHQQAAKLSVQLEGVGKKADVAYEEANHVNQKIADVAWLAKTNRAAIEAAAQKSDVDAVTENTEAAKLNTEAIADNTDAIKHSKDKP